MLFLLSTEGRIARARPLGTWLSSQYRWVPMADWIGALPDLDEAEARAELVRRWLLAYGPGTVDDLAWWTKWTKANVRAALADVGAVAVTTDTGDGAGGAGVGRCRTISTTRRPTRRPGRRRAGVAAAGARPDDHGVEGAGVVPRPASGARCSTATATPGRPCGSAGGRSACGASVEGGTVVTRLLEDVDAGAAIRVDAAAAAAHRVDGRRARHAAVPDPARPGAGRRLASSRDAGSADDDDAGVGQRSPRRRRRRRR